MADRSGGACSSLQSRQPSAKTSADRSSLRLRRDAIRSAKRISNWSRVILPMHVRHAADFAEKVLQVGPPRESGRLRNGVEPHFSAMRRSTLPRRTRSTPDRNSSVAAGSP